MLWICNREFDASNMKLDTELKKDNKIVKLIQTHRELIVSTILQVTQSENLIAATSTADAEKTLNVEYDLSTDTFFIIGNNIVITEEQGNKINSILLKHELGIVMLYNKLIGNWCYLEIQNRKFGRGNLLIQLKFI